MFVNSEVSQNQSESASNKSTKDFQFCKVINKVMSFTAVSALFVLRISISRATPGNSASFQ